MAGEKIGDNSSFEFRYSGEGSPLPNQEQFALFAQQLYENELGAYCDKVYAYPQSNLIVSQSYKNDSKEVRRTLYMEERREGDYSPYHEVVFPQSSDRYPIVASYYMDSCGMWLDDTAYIAKVSFGNQSLSLHFSNDGRFEGVSQHVFWDGDLAESWSWRADESALLVSSRSKGKTLVEIDDKSLVFRSQIGRLVVEGLRVPRQSRRVSEVLQSAFGNTSLVTDPLEVSAEADWDTWIDWKFENVLGIQRVDPEYWGQRLPRAEDNW